MYVFNKITVKPQLPDRIGELDKIASNLWWSWNTDYLKLFKQIDIDLWERIDKNPIRFLKLVQQEKLEIVAKNLDFLKLYDEVVANFDAYMKSKNTWFAKKYPDNKSDLIAYFSAEYGLDRILPIYSGGLGMLSGDHLKTASDLGIPLVAIGLLYKKGFFDQKIDVRGRQIEEYPEVDIDSLPIAPVLDEEGKERRIRLKLPEGDLYLKVWQLDIGRIKLYLLDSDVKENSKDYRGITANLYGGDQETRIQQEIVLGMGGTKLLKELGLTPSVYHMNEGHSAFLILELMKDIIKEKKVSMEIAKEIVSSKTVFTTHTPVPAGNDVFPIELFEKYFDEYWKRLGIEKEEFLRLGMQPETDEQDIVSKISIDDKEDVDEKSDKEVKEEKNEKLVFNMGIFALKFAGKKNGVSKLHGAVSRELFADVWPNIAPNESPIDYVTNGIHTCTWLAPIMKKLYNNYLKPYWQDDIQSDETWKKIQNIPDKELWDAHQERKVKLIEVAKANITNRLKRNGYGYDEIDSITRQLNPNALTIGFSRRFATYKRATLIFRDIERLTQILNNQDRPVQILFAGKAHPSDQAGKDLIKYINDISLKPQFKGKIFLLENYNMAISKYLVSGVDVWLNTPRRPMEASGTSGQKAAANGVINFSVLDGWWAEGYNQKNGWIIGTNADYSSYEEQDRADSESLYSTLENKIIPMYYDKNANGISENWVETMKNTIASNAGKYSTSRMLVDYTSKFYVPLINLNKTYFTDLSTVTEYNEWKNNIYKNWNDIEIIQLEGNKDNITIDAGNQLEVNAKIKLPNIDKDSVEVQVYYGQILENGIVDNITIIPMDLTKVDDEKKEYEYRAIIELKAGGDYGYTFRVMPKNKMVLDSANLNLVKWIMQ